MTDLQIMGIAAGVTSVAMWLWIRQKIATTDDPSLPRLDAGTIQQVRAAGFGGIAAGVCLAVGAGLESVPLAVAGGLLFFTSGIACFIALMLWRTTAPPRRSDET